MAITNPSVLTTFNTPVRIHRIELFPLAASDGDSPEMAIGTMAVRPALLLCLTDSDGCSGWGEVWANFPPRANLHKTHLVEDVIAPKLIGFTLTEPRDMHEYLRAQLSLYFLHIGQSQVFEHLVAGLDIALWDLCLRKHNISVSALPGISHNPVKTYASSINGSDLEQQLPLAVSRGQHHFKIKVGFQKDLGYDLVKRAANLCPADGQLMIDSNQVWTLPQAQQALQQFAEFSPLFAEEPLAANARPADWETLANSTSIPLAGGENFYGIDQFVTLANAGLTVLQPDVAKWGGITGALELAQSLPEGTHLWPHFMGTAVGQMAALFITAAVGGDSVCELDVNRNPLRTDLCGDILQIESGCIALSANPGLVIPPLPEKLAAYGQLDSES